MTTTGIIATWAAIVATIALAWNIYNSRSDKPIIRVTTRRNVGYPDSRVLETKITDHGENQKLALYCHIEITNIGKLPTTITDIKLSHEDNGKDQFFCTSHRFEFFEGKKIPFLLGSGELLSCRIEMPDLERVSEHGKPEFQVSASHLKSPLLAQPDLQAARN